MKVRKYGALGERLCFCFHGKQNAMNFLKINKTRFGQGGPPENLGYRHEENKNKKNYGAGDV